MHTFDKIVAMEHESYVWLCVVNLLTSAVRLFHSLNLTTLAE